MDQSITREQDGQASSRDTGVQYAYDGIGNLTEEDDLGQVGSVNLEQHQMTDVDYQLANGPTYSDALIKKITYANAGQQSAITGKPDFIALYDATGRLLRQTKLAYWPKGNLKTQSRTLLADGGAAQDIVELEYTYDALGNVATETDAAGVTTAATALDATMTYPAAQTIGGNWNVSSSYDPATGYPLKLTDQKGVTNRYAYDPLFRIKGTYISNSSQGVPKTQNLGCTYGLGGLGAELRPKDGLHRRRTGRGWQHRALRRAGASRPDPRPRRERPGPGVGHLLRPARQRLLHHPPLLRLRSLVYGRFPQLYPGNHHRLRSHRTAAPRHSSGRRHWLADRADHHGL